MKNDKIIQKLKGDFRTIALTHRLNSLPHSPKKTRKLFGKIIGQKLDEKSWVIPPFFMWILGAISR